MCGMGGSRLGSKLVFTASVKNWASAGAASLGTYCGSTHRRRTAPRRGNSLGFVGGASSARSKHSQSRWWGQGRGCCCSSQRAWVGHRRCPGGCSRAGEVPASSGHSWGQGHGAPQLAQGTDRMSPAPGASQGGVHNGEPPRPCAAPALASPHSQRIAAIGLAARLPHMPLPPGDEVAERPKEGNHPCSHWALTGPPLPLHCLAGVHARLPGGAWWLGGAVGLAGAGRVGTLVDRRVWLLAGRRRSSTRHAEHQHCTQWEHGTMRLEGKVQHVCAGPQIPGRAPTWPARDCVGGRLNSGNAASCLLQWSMTLTKDPQATSTSVLVDIGVVVRALHWGLPALPSAAGDSQQRRGTWWPGWAALSTGKAPPPCRRMCLFTRQHTHTPQISSRYGSESNRAAVDVNIYDPSGNAIHSGVAFLLGVGWGGWGACGAGSQTAARSRWRQSPGSPPFRGLLQGLYHVAWPPPHPLAHAQPHPPTPTPSALPPPQRRA